jgi:hypothetical protein
MAFGAGNDLSIAWRHVYAGNMRDMAFVRSEDGGRTFSAPVRISEDKWSIAGCPDDGPAMALDASERVHVVWPTVVVENGEPRKSIFYAMSADGASFLPRVRLPTEGHANHPQVAVASDGSLVVAWDESGDGGRRVAFARGVVEPSGQATFGREQLATAVGGIYPVVTAVPGTIVRAWTSVDAPSVIRVARSR